LNSLKNFIYEGFTLEHHDNDYYDNLMCAFIC